MKPLVALLAVAFLVVIIVAYRRHERNRESAGAKLREYLGANHRFQIWVGVPVGKPDKWANVGSVDSTTVHLPDGTGIPLDDLKSFVIAYQNNELLHVENECAPLPSQLVGLTWNPVDEVIVLPLSLLEDGATFVKVVHGPRLRRHENRRSWYHATTLTNVSTDRVRILRFAACSVEKERMRIRGFFTADQFNNWFNVGSDGWIQSGETVSDVNNYSDPGALWVYFLETEDGREFVTGSRFAGDWV